MTTINTDILVAKVSAQVSAEDGVLTDIVQVVGASAYLFDMADAFRRCMTRIHTASAGLQAGGSTAAVAFSGWPNSGFSGITGLWQGWPFATISGGSGSPTSLISTASNTIRKVLCTMKVNNGVIPPASSISSLSAVLQFVYGSAYATSAGAVTTGGQSAYFNLVPLPKPSAGEIPVGWINVPNSFVTSAALSAPMMITDWREIQGLNFSAILGVVQQP
jgi:hypothetical protein